MLEPHIAPPACVTVTQLDKGNSFRTLHQGTRAFVIGNAWDAGSARVLAGLGFAAIATSSYANAGAYGTRDGRITPTRRSRMRAPSLTRPIFRSRPRYSRWRRKDKPLF